MLVFVSMLSYIYNFHGCIDISYLNVRYLWVKFSSVCMRKTLSSDEYRFEFIHEILFIFFEIFSFIHSRRRL